MNCRGFTLVELMVAMTLGVLVATGVVHVAQSLGLSWRTQDESSRLHEHARLLNQVLFDPVRSAGYHPTPWLDSLGALGAGTRDEVNTHGDQIELQRRSTRNCYGNTNPVSGPGGGPASYLQINRFLVRGGQFVRHCRYGPDAGSLTTQINHLGLVEHVEHFQVLYAEDTDADGLANRWVRAGQWQEESRILGVRFAFLLASPGPLTQRRTATFNVLGRRLRTPADGRLRLVADGTLAIGGRL